jgi:hypothetical protein
MVVEDREIDSISGRSTASPPLILSISHPNRVTSHSQNLKSCSSICTMSQVSIKWILNMFICVVKVIVKDLQPQVSSLHGLLLNKPYGQTNIFLDRIPSGA